MKTWLEERARPIFYGGIILLTCGIITLFTMGTIWDWGDSDSDRCGYNSYWDEDIQRCIPEYEGKVFDPRDW